MTTDGEITAAFEALPIEHQDGLARLRRLVLDVADEVGAAPVQEVLRWGQPAYLAATPGRSTATRLGSTKDGSHFGVFFHCQSSVVSRFREAFPDDFTYDGNRGILFAPGDDLHEDQLRQAIAHALTYRA